MITKKRNLKRNFIKCISLRFASVLIGCIKHYRHKNIGVSSITQRKNISSNTGMYSVIFSLVLSVFLIFGCSSTSSLRQYHKSAPNPVDKHVLIQDFSFNGYTTHWQDQYKKQIRYSNLIRFDVPDIAKTILQSKVDIATDIGLPGLQMQEEFLNTLFDATYVTLEDPSFADLQKNLAKKDVLVYVNPETETGKKLNELLEGRIFPTLIPSHQYDAEDLIITTAYVLENGQRKLWIVSSTGESERTIMKGLIRNCLEIVSNYDLHKGWFGVKTLLKSVTATPGHPVEVIGRGMNEGNSWFVFDGYMEFLAKDEITKWVEQAGIPVVADVGFFPVYGCQDYEEFQVQSMFTRESWIEFANERDGYVFRPVFDPYADSLNLIYDGFLASSGNKVQIDQEEVPFVLPTGDLLSGAIPSMVLFIKKRTSLTKESMWKAILDRRAVGIAEKGKMMGPSYFRKALGMLTLDRKYLEDYFNDQILLETDIEGYNLNVNIRNTSMEPISGSLRLTLSPGLNTNAFSPKTIKILPGQAKTLKIPLQPEISAMDYANPVAVTFEWSGGHKTTTALLDLPAVITASPVSFGFAPTISYPVTVHNYLSAVPYPVIVEVFRKGQPGEPILVLEKTGSALKSDFQTLNFDLELNEGDYKVWITALESRLETQLGVRRGNGKPRIRSVDLNNDGVDEYILENDSVQVTLLTTGARVIDYTVKSKQDNLLFKLWPDRPVDDRFPFRTRRFYPYGGFEDFLGQPSIETHHVYEAEILSVAEDRVSVRMKTGFFGSVIEKTFTLYGNTPLLEIQFAVTTNRPELNVLGPQPILEIGHAHGPEDVFILPELTGYKEYRMKPEHKYGRIAYLKEGWNAGWDSNENIFFLGAMPVDLPMFMHMWMNHPSSNDSKYYYAEFQPWIPIPRHSTLHFNYFIWGASGSWESGLKALKSRNLIETTKKN